MNSKLVKRVLSESFELQEDPELIVEKRNSSGVVVRGVRWSDLSARKQLWDSLNNKDLEDINYRKYA